MKLFSQNATSLPNTLFISKLIALSLLAGACSTSKFSNTNKAQRLPSQSSDPCAGWNTNTPSKAFILKAGETKEGVTPAQVNEIKAVVQEVQKLASPELRHDLELTLNVFKEFNNAYFNPQDVSLNVPYQLVSLKVLDGNDTDIILKKHPTFTKPVYAHEFGHYLFSENIQLNGCPISYQYQNLFKQYAEVNALIEEVFQSTPFPGDVEAEAEKLKLMQQNVLSHAVVEPQHIQDLGSQFKFLRQKIDEAEIQAKAKERKENLDYLLDEREKIMMQILSVSEMGPHYNELFADVVAFFYSKNPEAITNALHFSGNTGRNRHAELRGFQTRPSKTLKLLMGTPPKSFSKIPASEASIYEVLNPSREHLFKHYLSRPDYKKEPAKVLSKLIKIFQEQMQANSQNGDYEHISIQALNDQLIRSIDKNLTL